MQSFQSPLQGITFAIWLFGFATQLWFSVQLFVLDGPRYCGASFGAFASSDQNEAACWASIRNSTALTDWGCGCHACNPDGCGAAYTRAFRSGAVLTAIFALVGFALVEAFKWMHFAFDSNPKHRRLIGFFPLAELLLLAAIVQYAIARHRLDALGAVTAGGAVLNMLALLANHVYLPMSASLYWSLSASETDRTNRVQHTPVFITQTMHLPSWHLFHTVSCEDLWLEHGAEPLPAKRHACFCNAPPEQQRLVAPECLCLEGCLRLVLMPVKIAVTWLVYVTVGTLVTCIVTLIAGLVCWLVCVVSFVCSPRYGANVKALFALTLIPVLLMVCWQTLAALCLYALSGVAVPAVFCWRADACLLDAGWGVLATIWRNSLVERLHYYQDHVRAARTWLEPVDVKAHPPHKADVPFLMVPVYFVFGVLSSLVGAMAAALWVPVRILYNTVHVLGLRIREGGCSNCCGCDWMLLILVSPVLWVGATIGLLVWWPFYAVGQGCAEYRAHWFEYAGLRHCVSSCHPLAYIDMADQMLVSVTLCLHDSHDLWRHEVVHSRPTAEKTAPALEADLGVSEPGDDSPHETKALPVAFSRDQQPLRSAMKGSRAAAAATRTIDVAIT